MQLSATSCLSALCRTAAVTLNIIHSKTLDTVASDTPFPAHPAPPHTSLYLHCTHHQVLVHCVSLE